MEISSLDIYAVYVKGININESKYVTNNAYPLQI